MILIGTILISYFYRIRNRPGYIWLFYENEKHNHTISNIIEYINKNHPEIITFYIINKNETDYPQNINTNNLIKYGSMYHKIYFILSSKLITDKKAIIEPWNYGQFNKLFKWSGPKKEYVLLQNEMIAEDILE